MAGFSLTALVRKAPFLAAVNAKEKALQAVISALRHKRKINLSTTECFFKLSHSR